MTEPNEETSSTPEELATEAYNLMRDVIENLLSVMCGTELGVSQWVVVAVPSVRAPEGHSIPLDPKIITERYLPDWMVKGMLADASDAFRRDDILREVVEVLSGEDDDD